MTINIYNKLCFCATYIINDIFCDNFYHIYVTTYRYDTSCLVTTYVYNNEQLIYTYCSNTFNNMKLIFYT